MSRRGSIYIMVLITSAFVLASGLAALSLEQRVTNRSELIDGVGSARFATRSGLDVALQLMADDPAWRSAIAANGLFMTREISAGDSTHTVRVYAESDGDISNDGLLDPFTLRVVATQTDTRRSLEVLIQPLPLPVDILEFGAYSADNVVGGSLSYVNGDTGIAAASDFLGTSATYFVPVETEKSLPAATFVSTAIENGLAHEFVSEENLVSIYEPYGTWIAESELRFDGSTYVVEKVSIGPGLIPFGLLGVLTPSDVYVIDHGSRDIIIRDSRIVATIVFIGSGQVILDGSVSWEPATPGWPAIVTDSNVVFRMSSNSLSEAVTLTNFNPPDLGTSEDKDLDTADFYASQIEGIVYTRGMATVESGTARIVGHLVTKNDIVIDPGAILELRASRASLDNTPPGFESAIRFEMFAAQWLDP